MGPPLKVAGLSSATFFIFILASPRLPGPAVPGLAGDSEKAYDRAMVLTDIFNRKVGKEEARLALARWYDKDDRMDGGQVTPLQTLSKTIATPSLTTS